MRAELIAHAINEFTAFIHCEQSRSEVPKTLDHELITSTMCALRFEMCSKNRLDEKFKYILKTTLFAQNTHHFVSSCDRNNIKTVLVSISRY